MKLPEDYIESMRQLLGEEELQNYLDCLTRPELTAFRSTLERFPWKHFKTDTLSSDTGSLGGKWILL